MKLGFIHIWDWFLCNNSFNVYSCGQGWEGEPGQGKDAAAGQHSGPSAQEETQES